MTGVRDQQRKKVANGEVKQMYILIYLYIYIITKILFTRFFIIPDVVQNIPDVVHFVL